MKLTVYVDYEHHVFTHDQVHDIFTNDVFQDEKASYLLDFVNCLDPDHCDDLINMLTNCDRTPLGELSDSFNDYIRAAESDWIEENYYYAEMDV